MVSNIYTGKRGTTLVYSMVIALMSFLLMTSTFIVFDNGARVNKRQIDGIKAYYLAASGAIYAGCSYYYEGGVLKPNNIANNFSLTSSGDSITVLRTAVPGTNVVQLKGTAKFGGATRIVSLEIEEDPEIIAAYYKTPHYLRSRFFESDLPCIKWE